MEDDSKEEGVVIKVEAVIKVVAMVEDVVNINKVEEITISSSTITVEVVKRTTNTSNMATKARPITVTIRLKELHLDGITEKLTITIRSEEMVATETIGTGTMVHRMVRGTNKGDAID